EECLWWVRFALTPSPLSVDRGGGDRRGRSDASRPAGRSGAAGALGPGGLLAPAPEHRKDPEHHRVEDHAEQHGGRQAETAERERDQLDEAGPRRDQRDYQPDHDQHAADAYQDARATRGREQAHHAQAEQRARGGSLLTKPLDRHLEVTGAPLGEGQRGVGHPADLHPLLRMRGGHHRLLEPAARRLRVVALGGAGTEDRERDRAVLLLGLELLVAARLHLLHDVWGDALLDADLTLLGCHGDLVYGPVEDILGV